MFSLAFWTLSAAMLVAMGESGRVERSAMPHDLDDFTQHRASKALDSKIRYRRRIDSIIPVLRRKRAAPAMHSPVAQNSVQPVNWHQLSRPYPTNLPVAQNPFQPVSFHDISTQQAPLKDFPQPNPSPALPQTVGVDVQQSGGFPSGVGLGPEIITGPGLYLGTTPQPGAPAGEAVHLTDARVGVEVMPTPMDVGKMRDQLRIGNAALPRPTDFDKIDQQPRVGVIKVPKPMNDQTGQQIRDGGFDSVNFDSNGPPVEKWLTSPRGRNHRGGQHNSGGFNNFGSNRQPLLSSSSGHQRGEGPVETWRLQSDGSQRDGIQQFGSEGFNNGPPVGKWLHSPGGRNHRNGARLLNSGGRRSSGPPVGKWLLSSGGHSHSGARLRSSGGFSRPGSNGPPVGKWLLSSGGRNHNGLKLTAEFEELNSQPGRRLLKYKLTDQPNGQQGVEVWDDSDSFGSEAEAEFGSDSNEVQILRAEDSDGVATLTQKPYLTELIDRHEYFEDPEFEKKAVKPQKPEFYAEAVSRQPIAEEVVVEQPIVQFIAIPRIPQVAVSSPCRLRVFGIPCGQSLIPPSALIANERLRSRAAMIPEVVVAVPEVPQRQLIAAPPPVPDGLPCWTLIFGIPCPPKPHSQLLAAEPAPQLIFQPTPLNAFESGRFQRRQPKALQRNKAHSLGRTVEIDRYGPAAGNPNGDFQSSRRVIARDEHIERYAPQPMKVVVLERPQPEYENDDGYWGDYPEAAENQEWNEEMEQSQQIAAEQQISEQIAQEQRETAAAERERQIAAAEESHSESSSSSSSQSSSHSDSEQSSQTVESASDIDSEQKSNTEMGKSNDQQISSEIAEMENSSADSTFSNSSDSKFSNSSESEIAENSKADEVSEIGNSETLREEKSDWESDSASSSSSSSDSEMDSSSASSSDINEQNVGMIGNSGISDNAATSSSDSALNSTSGFAVDFDAQDAVDSKDSHSDFRNSSSSSSSASSDSTFDANSSATADHRGIYEESQEIRFDEEKQQRELAAAQQQWELEKRANDQSGDSGRSRQSDSRADQNSSRSDSQTEWGNQNQSNIRTDSEANSQMENLNDSQTDSEANSQFDSSRSDWEASQSQSDSRSESEAAARAQDQKVIDAIAQLNKQNNGILSNSTQHSTSDADSDNAVDSKIDKTWDSKSESGSQMGNRFGNGIGKLIGQTSEDMEIHRDHRQREGFDSKVDSRDDFNANSDSQSSASSSSDSESSADFQKNLNLAANLENSAAQKIGAAEKLRDRVEANSQNGFGFDSSDSKSSADSNSNFQNSSNSNSAISSENSAAQNIGSQAEFTDRLNSNSQNGLTADSTLNSRSDSSTDFGSESDFQSNSQSDAALSAKADAIAKKLDAMNAEKLKELNAKKRGERLEMGMLRENAAGEEEKVPLFTREVGELRTTPPAFSGQRHGMKVGSKPGELFDEFGRKIGNLGGEGGDEWNRSGLAPSPLSAAPEAQNGGFGSGSPLNAENSGKSDSRSPGGDPSSASQLQQLHKANGGFSPMMLLSHDRPFPDAQPSVQLPHQQAFGQNPTQPLNSNSFPQPVQSQNLMPAQNPNPQPIQALQQPTNLNAGPNSQPQSSSTQLAAELPSQPAAEPSQEISVSAPWPTEQEEPNPMPRQVEQPPSQEISVSAPWPIEQQQPNPNAQPDAQTPSQPSPLIQPEAKPINLDQIGSRDYSYETPGNKRYPRRILNRAKRSAGNPEPENPKSALDQRKIKEVERKWNQLEEIGDIMSGMGKDLRKRGYRSFGAANGERIGGRGN